MPGPPLIKAAHIELAFLSSQGEPLSLEQARTLSRISVQQPPPSSISLSARALTTWWRLADRTPVHLNLLASGRTLTRFTSTGQAHYF